MTLGHHRGSTVSTLKLCAGYALRLHRLQRLRSGRTAEKPATASPVRAERSVSAVEARANFPAHGTQIWSRHGTTTECPNVMHFGLVLSHFEFEGFRFVMPALRLRSGQAPAGIQGEQAAACGYSVWIPAFAGMTQHSSTPQNHHDSLLNQTA